MYPHFSSTLENTPQLSPTTSRFPTNTVVPGLGVMSPVPTMHPTFHIAQPSSAPGFNPSPASPSFASPSDTLGNLDPRWQQGTSPSLMRSLESQAAAATRRRSRDKNSEDENTDELTHMHRKKVKKDPILIVEGYGQQYGLMGDLWRDIGITIATGLQRDSQPQLSNAHFEAWDNKHYKLYKHLKSIVPDIAARIAGGGESGALNLAAQLDRGRKRILQNMNNGVKNAIRDWYNFAPALVQDKKFDHGFHHDDCGRMLCPVDLNWDDERVREGLRTCDFGRYHVDHDHLPAFLWPGLNVNLENMVEGFCRNILIVKATMHVLQGPGAATAIEAGGEPAHRRNANTKPRAGSWGITRITPACIAASAVLVRFALSDEKNFSPSGKGRFLYLKFYHKIINFIKETMPEAECANLLDWYNMRILGSPILEDSDNDSENEENSGAIMSPFARMVAQAKQGRQHASASAVQGPLGDAPSFVQNI